MTSPTMFSLLQVGTVLFLISQLSRCSSAYELQDTFHTLKEENLHMQHRLENLTRALRDLKHLLKVSAGEHGSDFLHVWKEWSQHGISVETHQTLEQVLCFTELHGAAQPIFITSGFLVFLSPFVSMNLLLLP